MLAQFAMIVLSDPVMRAKIVQAAKDAPVILKMVEAALKGSK